MAVTFTQDARTLTARLSGELDHHTARSVMEQMEEHLGQGYGAAFWRDRIDPSVWAGLPGDGHGNHRYPGKSGQL